MLPCNGCAYREEIAGNVHIRCVFKWEPKDIFRPANRRAAQWFMFPFNYDPTWGPDACPNRAETRDSDKTMPKNPLLDLLSLLAWR